MTSTGRDRWHRAGELLSAALQRTPDEWPQFLKEACPDDEDMRSEIASLLAAHGRTGPLERLADGIAPFATLIRGAFDSFEGRTIGGYRVLERIARGTRGIAHKAHDAKDGRTVVITFLEQSFPAGTIERLHNQIRAIAALEHLNICAITESGLTEDGHPYLIMPFHEGEGLSERISRVGVTASEAAAIAVQALRGLASAHAAGLVHGDVTPSNLFINAGGTVMLLGFGAAPDGTSPGADLETLGNALRQMVAASPADTREEGSAVLQDVARVAERAGQYRSAEDFEEALLAISEIGRAADQVLIVRRRGERLSGALVQRDGAGPQREESATPAGVRHGTAVWMPPALGVLPFVEPDANTTDPFFGDGITQELRASLSRIEGLRVASLASPLTHLAGDARAAGRKLGVAAVLEGRVQRGEAAVRITTSLTRVSDGALLGAEVWSGDATDGLSIQEDIAAAIAATLCRRVWPDLPAA